MSYEATRIGDLLIASGFITPEILDQALREQERRPEPLGAILLASGAISREQLDDSLAEHFGVPLVELDSFSIDTDAREALPEEIARKYRAVPLFLSGDSMMIAMSNPDDIVALDEIRQGTGLEIDVSYAFEEDIDAAIRRLYGASDSLLRNVKELIRRYQSIEINNEDLSSEGGPIGELVEVIVGHAIDRGSSDLHIEPLESSVRWRMRIDGFLENGPSLSRSIHNGLVTRIKILSDLDISESRRPQDGHFPFRMGARRYDIRVSIIPTIVGENVVLRIIDLYQSNAGLNKLGLIGEPLSVVESVIDHPHGLVLVTGPTGSGKSTTLYSMLDRLESPSRHVVTIEDPVERNFDEVRQIQVNPKAGLTFAEGLRAILRHDPDIIMIGEIRDSESADIAIQSALTGHLVLSSLHTNDAPGAVARLTDLGVEPFLLAAALRGVIAQRLLRKLCSECRTPHRVEVETAQRFDIDPEATIYQATGCDVCRGSGYRGRVGIFEVMPSTAALSRAITSGASTDDIREVAKSEGMSDLRQQAIELALGGKSSLEETIRSTL